MKNKYKKWTDEEDQFIRENVSRMSNAEIAEILIRTVSSVSCRITHLGIARRKNGPRWTVEEDKFLRENVDRMKNREIAQRLGRTLSATQTRISALGIYRKNGPKAWRPEEDRFLEETLNLLTSREMSEKLGRSKASVSNRLNILGLYRNPEAKERMMNATRFPKGHIPANKGDRGGPSLSPATTFKKGQKPHNTKHDGAVSVRLHRRTKTPYKFIRISAGNWVHLHRHIWEEAHGLVPKGHIVRFKDGDTLNCSLENLEMISWEENIRRTRQMDGYVAMQLSGRDKNLAVELIKHPELLDLKRAQLKLKREIENAGDEA